MKTPRWCVIGLLATCCHAQLAVEQAQHEVLIVDLSRTGRKGAFWYVATNPSRCVWLPLSMQSESTTSFSLDSAQVASPLVTWEAGWGPSPPNLTDPYQAPAQRLLDSRVRMGVTPLSLDGDLSSSWLGLDGCGAQTDYLARSATSLRFRLAQRSVVRIQLNGGLGCETLYPKGQVQLSRGDGTLIAASVPDPTPQRCEGPPDLNVYFSPLRSAPVFDSVLTLEPDFYLVDAFSSTGPKSSRGMGCWGGSQCDALRCEAEASSVSYRLDVLAACPSIESGPSPLCASTDAPFSLQISVVGTSPTFEWLHDGFPIIDDGRISGARTQHLAITAAQPSDEGMYECVVSNLCGTVTSSAVRVTVVCPGDFNQDGGVDGQDLFAFFDAWVGGLSPADVNSDGGVDGGDLASFMDRWSNGC